MITLAAVTSDFHEEMFNQRHDDELIPPRLEERGMPRQGAMARRGIEWLQAGINPGSAPRTRLGCGEALTKFATFTAMPIAGRHRISKWADGPLASQCGNT